MPKTFTVTSSLTSGSSSFGGWNSALIVHSDSGFQRKAGPSYFVDLCRITFVEPSSAGLSFDEMHFDCFIFEFSFIIWTLLATKILKRFALLLM